MRPVYVTTVDNVFDSTGALLVPSGTRGAVKSVFDPPSIQRYEVTFTILGVPTDVWVSSADVEWDDGLLGPVRAIIQKRSTVLVDCEFHRITTLQDLVVGGNSTASTDSIKFVTDDGYAITVSSNANNDIVVDYQLAR